MIKGFEIMAEGGNWEFDWKKLVVSKEGIEPLNQLSTQ